jgi:hypothetical protein
VEDGFLACWIELKYDAASEIVIVVAAAGIVGAAVGGRPIQVSVLVKDQSCLGIRSVGAVGLRTEAVKHTIFLSRRRSQQHGKNEEQQHGVPFKRAFQQHKFSPGSQFLRRLLFLLKGDEDHSRPACHP